MNERGCDGGVGRRGNETGRENANDVRWYVGLVACYSLLLPLQLTVHQSSNTANAT